jgi:hypothetical protein
MLSASENPCILVHPKYARVFINIKRSSPRGVRTKSWTEYTQEGDRGCIQRNNIEKPWRFMKKRNR